MYGMAIRRFFVAFIRPRLVYCGAVWCGASPALLKDLEEVQLRVSRATVRNPTLQDASTLQQAHLPTSWRRREHCLGLLWQLYTGKGLLHYRPHWCLVHSYSPFAFLMITPFVFLLVRRLVTCRPFSVKLSSSGKGCLLLSSLLRLSLLFGQRFDAILPRICSAMVSLCSFLSFFS